MINKKILLYYNCLYIFNNDLDKEANTSNMEKNFHLFFFHNNDLHFNKKIIKYQILDLKFSNIKPLYFYKKYEKNKSVLVQIKKIEEYTTEEFKKEVDLAYKNYLNTINYRINSIIETIKLFLKLYRDKTVIFIVPQKLKNIIKKNIKNYKIIKTEKEILFKLELFYWINYFLKISSANKNLSNELNTFSENIITGIYEIK